MTASNWAPACMLITLILINDDNNNNNKNKNNKAFQLRMS